MKKQKIWALVLAALLLGLSLAGCGNGQPGQAQAEPEPEGGFLYYNDGYITTDGQVFRNSGNRVYSVLYDVHGRQRYILASEPLYDYQQVNEYGLPLPVGCNYAVYDQKGELQYQLAVDDADGQRRFMYDNNIQLQFNRSFDLSKSVVLLDMLRTQGRFQLLGTDGALLAEQDMSYVEDWQDFRDFYIWLCVGENFAAANLTAYDEHWEHVLEQAFLYDLSGQPLPTQQEYISVYPIYDVVAREDSPYFQAQYLTAQERYLYDVLDGNGQMILSGLNLVSGCSGDVFCVRRGFEQGLMRADGEWLFKEEIFGELED